MLSVFSAALVFVLASPVPVPKPVTSTEDAPDGLRPDIEAQTEVRRDDRTVIEQILDDLSQIGEETPPSPSQQRRSAKQMDAPLKPVEKDPAEIDRMRTLPNTEDQRIARSPLPSTRPSKISPNQGASPGSKVCGDPRLSGTMISQVHGKLRACGIEAPVRLTAVNGIKLSTAATLRCDAASTFADWLTGVADPHARQDLGSGISSVWVMASYACRTRNHRKGARLSEHAYGRAIDVGGFTLESGRKITVLEGWNKGSGGRFLRRVWRRACGPFKTVLGPDSDRFHRNHFHFDVAQRRSAFCR